MFLSLTGQINGPEILSSAGESFQSTTMQLDWTIGEISVNSYSGTNTMLTEGFHQPTYVYTKTIELPTEIGKITILPNPVSDKVQISMNFEQHRVIDIQLIDEQGKSIWTKQVNGKNFIETKDLSQLTNGVYFLNLLIDQAKYSQTYKIQILK